MQKNYFQFLLLFLSAFWPIFSSAQMSKNDSTFVKSICTEGAYVSYWNKPGPWFTNGEITSVQDMYDKINAEFVFSNEDYVDCYSQMQVSTEMQFDTAINATINNYEDSTGLVIYGLRNPLVKIPFTLQQKQGYARALLDSTNNISGNHDIAFMLITGTGNNFIKEIIDNVGYHNTNCQVMNYFKTRGDFYVMSVPNEDYRGITFNKKKMSYTMTSLYSSPFMINYLNSSNKAYGINRLIEYVAMIKYLKSKYKKVCVLGLSTGGKVAHWISLMAEPDAALVSSGYSVLVDNDYNSQIVNAAYYGNLLTIFTKDSLKKRAKELKTQFLFTLPKFDSPIAQLDIDSQYTKTFYQDVPNASFFYNYTNHAFPPCATMDSFFTRCLNKPKVFCTPDTGACNTDSLVVDLNFDGKAPFVFSVYKDSVIQNTDTAWSTQHQVVLYTAGNYWIDNIIDSNGTIGYRSDRFEYVKHPINSIQFSTPQFICDSSKHLLNLQLTGSAPWELTYEMNGVTQQETITSNTHPLMLSNGLYESFNIKDIHQCEAGVSNQFNFQTQLPGGQISQVQYDCAKNETRISLQTSGQLPIYWTYRDSLQQTNQTLVFNQANQDIILNNGYYRFGMMSDANQCQANPDTLIQINEEVLQLNFPNIQYTCGDSFAVASLNLQGRAPFEVQMEHAGNTRIINGLNNTDTVHLPNGKNLLKMVQDAKQCSLSPGYELNNPYEALSLQLNSSVLQCDEKVYEISAEVSGTFPIQYFIIQAGDTITGQWNESPVRQTMNPGAFQIIRMLDAAQCELLPALGDSLPFVWPMQPGISFRAPFLTAQNKSQGWYYWKHNEELIDSSLKANYRPVLSGSYRVGHLNQQACLQWSEPIALELDEIILYPNPVEDLLNIDLTSGQRGPVHMKICDMTGRILSEQLLNPGHHQISLKALQTGMYIVKFYTARNDIFIKHQQIFKR